MPTAVTSALRVAYSFAATSGPQILAEKPMGADSTPTGRGRTATFLPRSKHPHGSALLDHGGLKRTYSSRNEGRPAPSRASLRRVRQAAVGQNGVSQAVHEDQHPRFRERAQTFIC